MSALPNEVLLNILKFCDFATIREVSCTNKALHQLVEKNQLAVRRAARLNITEHGTITVEMSVNDTEGETKSGLYIFTVERDLKKYDRFNPFLWRFTVPDSQRDLVEGLRKAERWIRNGKGSSRTLTVSEPIAVVVPVLGQILKRISIHKFSLTCSSAEFGERVLEQLELNRTRIHSFDINCRTFDFHHMEHVVKSVGNFGIADLSLRTNDYMSVPSEFEPRFISSLSELKLTNFFLFGSFASTVPRCLLLDVGFRTVEGIVHILKEWARGEREIVCYNLYPSPLPREEMFAELGRQLHSVRGLCVSGYGKPILKLQKTTLPEGVEQQKYLYVDVRVRFSNPKDSVILRTSRHHLNLPVVSPCVECSEERRQVVQSFVVHDFGIDPADL